MATDMSTGKHWCPDCDGGAYCPRMTKACAGCREEKGLDEFWRSAGRKYGRDHYCTACRKSSGARKTHAGVVARSAAKYPLKQKARQMIARLIQTGEIVSEPCFLCSSLPAQAHHLDYEYAEKVIWLCSQHHAGVHIG